MLDDKKDRVKEYQKNYYATKKINKYLFNFFYITET